MNGFCINGHDGFVEIKFDEVLGFPNTTTYLGGYDVRGNVNLKSKGFTATGELWFSTGEIYHLYESLNKMYRTLEGVVEFSNADGRNLHLIIQFEKSGKFKIAAVYQESYEVDNVLHIELISDQSFLVETLQQLKSIYEYYGDDKGVKS